MKTDEVRFFDKDHVWVNGRQYISLKRGGEMLKGKRTTNADRIRSMTDEELAVWLAKHKYRRPTFDGWLPFCNTVMGPRICHEDGCEKCWLDWLKSPVDEEVRE